MTDYVVISANEYNLGKQQTMLSVENVQELLEYRDVFIKFLDKSKFNYQIELALGGKRGKEGMLYDAIDTIEELKRSLISLEKTFKDYKDSQEV